jgi:hypothetical protein
VVDVIVVQILRSVTSIAAKVYAKFYYHIILVKRGREDLGIGKLGNFGILLRIAAILKGI